MIRLMTAFFLCVVLSVSPHSHAANFSKTVLGLKLGMTLDEAKAIYPSLQVRMIKHWGTDDILFYTATIAPDKINNWIVVSMLFSAYNQGRKLFKLHVEQYVGDNVYGALEKKVIDRFGPPGCTPASSPGKKLVWGDCSFDNGRPGGKAGSGRLSFLYDNAQVSFILEDESADAFIKDQVLKYDEETRLKEVLELDF